MSTKIGKRRRIMQDPVGAELQECGSVKEMVRWCKKHGVTGIEKYASGKFHNGVAVMAITNRARAHFRHVSFKKKHK